VRLVGITSDNVKNIWFHVEHFIKAACKKGPGGLDPNELRKACETKRHQLWVLFGDKIEAAAITGIHDEGTRRAEWIAFGGSGDIWQEHMPAIEAWAKRQGCKAFRSYGRPGMRKRMPKGYRVRGIIFEKEL